MFDKAIIDTDRFMDLSMSSKALYFLLGMDADDEGFVSARKVQRVHGGNEDDVKVLIAKKFLIPFESGVVVITDWNNNNWLDSRRIKPTKYQEEKQLLAINKDKMYVLSNGLALAQPEESSIEESSISAKNKFSHERKIEIPSFEEFCTSQGYSAETRYLGEELGEGRVYLKIGYSSAKTEEKVREEYKSHVYRLEKGRGVSKTNKSPEHQIFSLFTVIEPTPSKWWENKTQKKASRDLFDLYGIEKVKNALSFYCKNKKEEFIPRIFSPHDLLNKFQQLKDFKERIKKGSSNFASEIVL